MMNKTLLTILSAFLFVGTIHGQDSKSKTINLDSFSDTLNYHIHNSISEKVKPVIIQITKIDTIAYEIRFNEDTPHECFFKYTKHSEKYVTYIFNTDNYDEYGDNIEYQFIFYFDGNIQFKDYSVVTPNGNYWLKKLQE